MIVWRSLDEGYVISIYFCKFLKFETTSTLNVLAMKSASGKIQPQESSIVGFLPSSEDLHFGVQRKRLGSDHSSDGPGNGEREQASGSAFCHCENCLGHIA